jgi:GNAT superfamily N-acetyltransferase
VLDRWFSTIKLPLSPKQFHQLPQNPAYKYEYVNKIAWLSPRPKFYSARLELHRHSDAIPESIDAQEAIGFRQYKEEDWSGLTRLFAGAFSRVQPFASLSDRRRLESARASLNFTREGGDGPLIASACHVAFGEEPARFVGAIFVTLIPMIDLDDFWSMRWQTPPPPDCIERGLGRPHLTWIFVGPFHAGRGIGSALLAHATRSLLDLGYTELISSFLLGNTASMLWHWRNGFELLPYVGSVRAMRARRKKAEPPADRSD